MHEDERFTSHVRTQERREVLCVYATLEESRPAADVGWEAPDAKQKVADPNVEGSDDSSAVFLHMFHCEAHIRRLAALRNTTHSDLRNRCGGVRSR